MQRILTDSWSNKIAYSPTSLDQRRRRSDASVQAALAEVAYGSLADFHRRLSMSALPQRADPREVR